MLKSFLCTLSVNGVSIYRSKCNENSYKTKKDISCKCKHFKNPLTGFWLSYNMWYIDINVQHSARGSFKKKKVPWWRLQRHQRHLSAAHLQWSVSGVTQSATLMEMKYLNCFDYSACTVLVFAAYEDMSITGHLILDFMTNNSNKISVGNFNILDLNDI